MTNVPPTNNQPLLLGGEARVIRRLRAVNTTDEVVARLNHAALHHDDGKFMREKGADAIARTMKEISEWIIPDDRCYTPYTLVTAKMLRVRRRRRWRWRWWRWWWRWSWWWWWRRRWQRRRRASSSRERAMGGEGAVQAGGAPPGAGGVGAGALLGMCALLSCQLPPQPPPSVTTGSEREGPSPSSETTWQHPPHPPLGDDNDQPTSRVVTNTHPRARARTLARTTQRTTTPSRRSA